MTKPRMVVRSRSTNQATDVYCLIRGGSHGPNMQGGAQAALDAMLAAEDVERAHLYLGGRYVAAIDRDGNVFRPS